MNSESKTAFLLILISLLFFTACSDESTPEDIVKSFIASAEDSVENSNSRKLRNLISDNYLDKNNRAKDDVSSTVSGYIFRNKNVHVLKNITSVQPINNDSISATILVALAGTPIADVSNLPTMNADIYWFDITINKEKNDWKLTSATWRQAMVDDFFKN